jgi:hypothetical protein
MFLVINLPVRLLKAVTSSPYLNLKMLMKVLSLIDILSWLSSTKFYDYFKNTAFKSASIPGSCDYF